MIEDSPPRPPRPSILRRVRSKAQPDIRIRGICALQGFDDTHAFFWGHEMGKSNLTAGDPALGWTSCHDKPCALQCDFAVESS